jgi:hypothetical protein
LIRIISDNLPACRHRALSPAYEVARAPLIAEMRDYR